LAFANPKKNVTKTQHPIAEAKFVPTFAGNAHSHKCGTDNPLFFFFFFFHWYSCPIVNHGG
jgi:hypothetical protein